MFRRYRIVVMTKRSQKQSQQIISFRFRFIRLPVVWDVLTGEKWEKYKTATLKNLATKLGRGLAADEIANVERSIPAAPLLRGRIRKVQAADAESLSEIENLRGMRDEFVGLPHGDLDRLAEFLNKVGAWPSSNDPSQSAPGHGLEFPLIVEPDAVWSFRDDLRHALLNRERFKEVVTPQLPKPATWIDLFARQPANDFHLRFELGKSVVGIVTLTNARHALFASVLADIARGIRFKMCARKGCNVPFPITSKHKKRYHSAECGHLAFMQRERAAAKRKGNARKAGGRVPRKSVAEPQE